MSVPINVGTAITLLGGYVRRYLMLFLCLVISRFAFADKPLTLTPRVDIPRYMGKWYEIARLPMFFQRNCVGSITQYRLKQDNRFDVHNVCLKKSGRSSANAKVRVVQDSGNAKMEVNFFGPFWGDYQVMMLDADYRIAMVGTPDREHLWILSRTPTLSAAQLAPYLDNARRQGFDLSELIYDHYDTPAP